MKKRRKADRGRAGKRKGAQSRSAATTPKDKTLQESEAKYGTLVEQSLQGILIGQGPPLRVAFVNAAMDGEPAAVLNVESRTSNAFT